MRATRALSFLAACAGLLLALSGCSGTSGSTSGGEFVGRTYLSSSVTENGAPRPLVGATPLTLTFTEDGVNASAGCNTMVASGGISDGVLELEAMSGTELACDPALMAQEQWWGEFLMASPAVVVGDRALTLSTPTAEVAMVSQETVPDLPLEQTTWQLDTIITGDTVSSVPAEVPVSLVLSEADMTVVVGDCRSTTAAASTTGSAITFDPAPFSATSCTGDAAVVDTAVMAVFQDGEVDYLVAGTRLTLTGPDGAGLVFQGS